MSNGYAAYNPSGVTTYPTSDEVYAFMAAKAKEPGFGVRNYTVTARVGKATVTLKKAAKVAPAKNNAVYVLAA